MLLRGIPMLMKTKALVLRDVSYKESDRMLTLLTQDRGKMSASARGSRKKGSPIAAGTQLLCWSELVLYEYRGRWSVKEAAVERQFRGVRLDLERFALGCYFAETAQTLALEDLPAPDLLSLLLNSLHVLDKKPELPLPLVKTVFEWRCMCAAGYEPQVEVCARCGAPEPEQPRFHPLEGLLYCKACRPEEDSAPLSPAALAALRRIVCADPKKLFSFRLDGASLHQLEALSERYLLLQLDRGFGTLDFYKQLSI